MIISNKKDNPNYGRTNTSSWWIFNGTNYNTTDREITNTTLIMMPSLRVNQSYDKAFHVITSKPLILAHLQPKLLR